MYFVRIFYGGGGEHDPRRKKWAEYQCNCCGELSQINVTANFTFDYNRTRVCPKCKRIDEQDEYKSLMKEKETLLHERSLIDEKINEISFKLQKFENNSIKKEIEEIVK